MFKKLLPILGLLLFFVIPINVYAHPANTASTIIEIQNAEPYKAQVTVIINWVQLYALTDSIANDNSLIQYLDFHFESLEGYIKEKLVINVDDSSCTLDINKSASLSKTEESATDIYLVGEILCSNSIKSGSIKVDLFNDIEPTQNYITILERLSEDSVRNIKGGLLTDIDNEINFTIVENAREGTDLQDTKSYSDKLITNFKKHLSEGSLSSLLIILLISLIVGSLHALEGGHSKLILTSLMIDKKTTIKDGLTFTSLFTLTHMSDLFIVGILLVSLDSIRSIYSIASQVQTFAIYSMVTIASWQLLKELSSFLKSRYVHSLEHKHFHEHSHHEHDHAHGYDAPNTFKEKMVLAFLEGLSPCLMGWTILFMVVSTGSIWLIFPVLFSFAIGIYLVLLAIMLLVYKFKIRLNEKITWFSQYSGLLSAILLLVTTIYLALIYL